jgi:heme/copper-type cytochrome/quinol oxidase subunit 3
MGAQAPKLAGQTACFASGFHGRIIRTSSVLVNRNPAPDFRSERNRRARFYFSVFPLQAPALFAILIEKFIFLNNGKEHSWKLKSGPSWKNCATC